MDAPFISDVQRVLRLHYWQMDLKSSLLRIQWRQPQVIVVLQHAWCLQYNNIFRNCINLVTFTLFPHYFKEFPQCTDANIILQTHFGLWILFSFHVLSLSLQKAEAKTTTQQTLSFVFLCHRISGMPCYFVNRLSCGIHSFWWTDPPSVFLCLFVHSKTSKWFATSIMKHSRRQSNIPWWLISKQNQAKVTDHFHVNNRQSLHWYSKEKL